jgi:hypothetical protein
MSSLHSRYYATGRVLFEKLIVAQVVNISHQAIMEHQGSAHYRVPENPPLVTITRQMKLL